MPADGCHRSRKEHRHLCGNGITRRAVELQRDTQRPRRRYPPSSSLSGREEGGGRSGDRRRRDRGGVLPEKLMFGCGHHRVDVCWPSSGRHKLS